MKKSHFKEINQMLGDLEEMKENLGIILAEITEKYENSSEKAQNNERGERRYSTMDSIENLQEEILTAMYSMQDILGEYPEYE